jgi:hydrogenase/urease accessory protein HupE
MSLRLIRRSLATLTTLFMPALAWAHSGHDGGMHHGNGIANFSHPIFDFDHLLVMIAVGIVVALVLKARH